jgi:hypothetical protein
MSTWGGSAEEKGSDEEETSNLVIVEAFKSILPL